MFAATGAGDFFTFAGITSCIGADGALLVAVINALGEIWAAAGPVDAGNLAPVPPRAGTGSTGVENIHENANMMVITVTVVSPTFAIRKKVRSAAKDGAVTIRLKSSSERNR